MICARCETENPPGAEFCLKCGARLIEMPQAIAPMNTWRIAIADVVLVVAAILWNLTNTGFYYNAEWEVANLGLSSLAVAAFLFSIAYAAYDVRKMSKLLLAIGIFLLAAAVLSHAIHVAYTVLIH